MTSILRSRLLKGVVSRHIEPQFAKQLEDAGLELKMLIQKRFGRSLFIREVDTGSCGLCESEIISATNPIYDLQRFGINFVASPRHADALLVTGALSKNMVLALRKTYEAMSEPKFVIACGDCALDGSLFKGSYYVESGLSDILPVILHIPGCPPSPIVIIQYLLSFLKHNRLSTE